MATAEETRRKEIAQRIRVCFDLEIDHIRAGDWRGPQVEAIALVGHLRDLHGTVCTCCPRRPDQPTDQPERSAA